MAVGGGDQGEALLPGQLAHPVVDRELLLERVALDLQIEPIAEDRLEIPHLAARLVHVAAADRARHRTRHAGGERDQSLAVRLEQGLVDARVVVEAVGERLGAQIAEVAVADVVLRQQYEVVADPLALVSHPFLARDVGLEADDGLDAVLLRFLIEIDHAKHVSVVGDGDGLHPRLLAGSHQIGQADGTVEQAVERVQMEMGEFGRHRGHCSAPG